MFASRYLAILALLVTLISASSIPNTSLVPRIIGGKPASANEFGYVVMVNYINDDDNKSDWTTGSLIAPNVIVTNIFSDMEEDPSHPERYNVHVGRKSPGDPSKFSGRKVSKIILYPDFDRKVHLNDIALLVLEDNVPDSDAIPAKVYTGDVLTDSHVRAAGFGITNASNPKSLPDQLMAVNLGLGSKDYCKKLSANFNPGTMVCTDGTAGKDICNADWGAPLAIQVDSSSNEWALLGLASFKPDIGNSPDTICGQSGLTSYYTDIASYVDWISRAASLSKSKFTVAGQDKTSSSSSSSATSDTTFLPGQSSSESSSSTVLAESNHDNGNSKRNTIIGAVCGSVGGVLVLLLIFFLFRWWHRREHFARDPVLDHTVQGIIAEEIGGAEAPVESKPSNVYGAMNTPTTSVNDTPVPRSNVQNVNIVEADPVGMPPAYEERDSSIHAAATSNDKEVYKN